MMDFHLIPVDEKDLDALLGLYQRCEDFLALGPQAYASAEMVLSDLALSRKYGGIFSGIFDTAGQLHGVLDLVESGWQGSPDTAYLSLLMIASESRGQGLGSQVLAVVEQRLLDRGVRRLCAGVQVNNPNALRFWQAHGFRVCSGPIQYPDGTTAVDLVKEDLSAHRPPATV